MTQFTPAQQHSESNEVEGASMGVAPDLPNPCQTLQFDLGTEGRYEPIGRAGKLVEELAKARGMSMEKESGKPDEALLKSANASYRMSVSSSSIPGPDTQYYPTLDGESFRLSLFDLDGNPLMVLSLHQSYGSNADGSMDWRSDATGRLLRFSDDQFVTHCCSALEDMYRKAEEDNRKSD